MKALDKVFDTQNIGIIGDKFHFIEAKENFLYEEGKKQTRKTVSKHYNCYRRN